MGTDWDRRVSAALRILKYRANRQAITLNFWSSPFFALVRAHLLKREPARAEYSREVAEIDRRMLRIINRYWR
ncbi:TPA: hypothetical protein VDU83_002502 [Pseudomonas aeruginosa]|nr:hypothetical protein [Pseudomonas aeruginosa]